MFFKLILENANGDRVDMTVTANRYMTSRVEGLNPPPGTISISSYAGMDGSYLNNAFIEKRNVVISFEMRQLQQELIGRTESGMNYDDLAEEILHLREVQEQTVMDDAAKAAHRERIQELLHFINSQPRTITEFDEALVKKLLESVKVCEFFLEFRFKSGVTISIEK